MYPVSDAFLDAIRGSHKVTARAELLADGSFVQDLDVVGGSVKVDENAAQLRSLTCTMADPTGTLTPASLTDPLAPAGNELRIWRGVETPTLTEEVPLGVFGIADVDVGSSSTGGATLSITGFDRSKKVEEARFSEPYYVIPLSTYDTLILFIIATQAPGVFQGISPNMVSIPTLTSAGVYNTGDDPWKAAREVAKSAGCDLYFDAEGRMILRNTPDPDQAAVVYGYAEGANGVTAVGESSAITDQQAEPVAATVWDDNPASPTYYLSKFGKKPRFYSSPFIKTAAQAQAAAAAILHTCKGMAEDVTFTTVVNPAHEVGDVVTVEMAAAKIDARYVLSSFTVPLTYAGAMSVSTRRRTT